MKNEKICIRKTVGIFTVIGLALVGLVLLMGSLANKSTSTSSRASSAQCIYETHQDCKDDGCTGLCTTGGCKWGTLQCKAIAKSIMPTLALQVNTSYCALNFKKKENTNTMESSSAIDDSSYLCEANPSYPPVETACSLGTKLGNSYGSGFPGSPFYICYIFQKSLSTTAPKGCPIDVTNVKCAEGFIFSEKESDLTWFEGKGEWGCSYRCMAKPNPKDTNPNWPCTKEGYKPLQGGGDSTWCAKY